MEILNAKIKLTFSHDFKLNDKKFKPLFDEAIKSKFGHEAGLLKSNAFGLPLLFILVYVVVSELLTLPLYEIKLKLLTYWLLLNWNRIV